jgi:hypothetical protein
MTLIERLRRQKPTRPGASDVLANPDGPEAADVIEQAVVLLRVSLRRDDWAPNVVPDIRVFVESWDKKNRCGD